MQAAALRVGKSLPFASGQGHLTIVKELFLRVEANWHAVGCDDINGNNLQCLPLDFGSAERAVVRGA